jgi:hypothetical protein
MIIYQYQLVKRILYVFTVYKYRPEGIVSPAIQIVQDPAESTASDADQLGAQITELCSIITWFKRVGLFAKSLPLARSASRTGESEFWSQYQRCRAWQQTMMYSDGLIVSSLRPTLTVKHVRPGGMLVNGWIGMPR